MNLMTGYTVTWRTCVCVCVCMCTVLIQCVCNRFLCKWLDACSPMLFAYDPVYDVCIVMRGEVILPRHTGVESSKVTYVISYNPPPPPPDDFNACRAIYRLDLNFGLWCIPWRLKSTLAWRKTSYWVMFEDSGYTCFQTEKVTCTCKKNWLSKQNYH